MKLDQLHKIEYTPMANMFKLCCFWFKGDDDKFLFGYIHLDFGTLKMIVIENKEKTHYELSEFISYQLILDDKGQETLFNHGQ